MMNHDDHNDSGMVSKHEDMELADKRDKSMKPLNRVSRACNACRKQKMRCEGAENPPCKRCRNAGLECMFEKPSREASLTGEAGLERIRNLESSVVDIRQAQMQMQESINEVLATLRGSNGVRAQSYQPYHVQQSPVHSSPSMHSQGSLPTPTPGHAHPAEHSMPPPQHFPTSGSLASILSGNHSSYRSPSQTHANMNMMHLPPPNANYGVDQKPSSSNNMLPPISSFPQGTSGQSQQLTHAHAPGVSSSLKRPGLTLSTTGNSAESSETDDDDHGAELTKEGMTAPFTELRRFADVAVNQNKIEKITDSEPPSRARTPTSPHRKQGRPSKRRKVAAEEPKPTFLDVVSKGLISEQEARDLFRVFYHGCSTFLSVFDQKHDTFDALHERSPFAVDCICMVAAQIRDKGKEPSQAYKRCKEEVWAISQATLFAPVTRLEVVQSMLLVAGWSENGWLPGGHAVRMALELGMHNAWPKLRARMQAGTTAGYHDDQSLVSACRTWFSLYIFEHQISYGTGRPAVLKDDESIAYCREILHHPLAMEDDMRLVSTVELMAVRERINNQLSPIDRPIDDLTFKVLRDADQEFQVWYANWDPVFAQRYEDAAFYRQSLTIQSMHAQLFHYAYALRNLNGPEDVARMPREQREIAIQSIRIARHCLEVTINSPAYREGMKYAVHYTHVTATFTASLLLRLSHLFPDECPFDEVKPAVKSLSILMETIPAVRYSLTLKVMLKRYKQNQRRQSNIQSPRQGDHRRPVPMHMDSSGSTPGGSEIPFSPSTYGYSQQESHMLQQGHASTSQQAQPQMPAHYAADAANVNAVWAQYETAPVSQHPTWVSDSTLGGQMFTQHGMGAFIVPPNVWGPPQTHIW